MKKFLFALAVVGAFLLGVISEKFLGNHQEVTLASAPILAEEKVPQQAKDKAEVVAVGALTADSIAYFKELDSLPTEELRSAQDSVSKYLLKAAREMYPHPSEFLRWILAGKPDTTVLGRFYENEDSPAISIVLSSFKPGYNTSQEILEVLSHEVGHFFAPRFQEKLSESVPAVSGRYGAGHLDTLKKFEVDFRNAYHHEKSVVRSSSAYFAMEYGALVKGKTSESDFFGQYVAELLGCYFSYFCSGGSLSNEEEALAKRYVQYLNGRAYPRQAAFEARQKLLVPVDDAIQKIALYYHPEKD
ncbi:MAG: hypothetical protein JWN50_361 [Parcubacteria group bacterium]|nr:hypothetical protein [Parcubacteria group bacterium]